MQTGIVTTGTEYISIGNGGWKLRGEIRKEDENKVRMGTKVMAQFAFGGKTQTKIESVDRRRRGVTVPAFLVRGAARRIQSRGGGNFYMEDAGRVGRRI